jgi:CRP-like cAMP-binding protein
MQDAKAITIERLAKLEPLSNLSQERLAELVTLSNVERLPIGVLLFREGDIDNQTIYLLDGDVQLSSADGKTDRVLTSKKPEAVYPIDDSQPRQFSCTALSRVDVLRVDNSVLDYMMMWDQMAASEQAEAEAQQQETAAAQPTIASEDTKKVKADTPVVKEKVAKEKTPPPPESIPAQTVPADEDRSWIRKMRHIMAFKNMPPANIKSLLENMETIMVEKGDVIVNQGEPGDYYYVLTEGEAKVTRMVELATLEPGASFGEEALVSGGTRNASVTMNSDGMLMRLSKEKFNELLKDPMLDRLSPDDARARTNKGAVWLDVRHAKEFAHSHMPKSMNIPLHEMRIRMEELDKRKQYVCVCGTGRRSSAAAFLLVQNGFKASVLNGGLKLMAGDLIS